MSIEDEIALERSERTLGQVLLDPLSWCIGCGGLLKEGELAPTCTLCDRIIAWMPEDAAWKPSPYGPIQARFGKCCVCGALIDLEDYANGLYKACDACLNK